MDIGPSEAETFWTDFLRKLARRGLRGVKLVISDAHEGIKAAVSKVLQRDLAALPRALHAQRPGACRHEAAARRLGLHRHRLRPGRCRCRPRRNGAASPISSAPSSPKLAALMDEAEADVLAYMNFPAQHRTKLHSHQPARAAQRRDQAPHRRRRHLPQRSRHHPARRRHPARTERRMGRPARPLHDAGNHRARRAMIPSSACPPWQPDRSGPSRRSS